MCGRRAGAFLEGSRRAGDSSSDAPGVDGISVLEQADMLVREGVGEHDQDGDRRRMSRLRGGVQGAVGISGTGEASSDEMSMTISHELRRTDTAQIDALTLWMATMSGRHRRSAWHGSEEIVHKGKRAELVPAVATETLHLGGGGRWGG